MTVDQKRAMCNFCVGNDLILKDNIFFVSESFRISNDSKDRIKIWNQKQEYLGELYLSEYYKLNTI